MKKYQDLALEIKRIHRAKRMTETPIVIGALAITSRNAKRVWYGRLILPYILILEVYSCQPSSVLVISGGK